MNAVPLSDGSNDKIQFVTKHTVSLTRRAGRVGKVLLYFLSNLPRKRMEDWGRPLLGVKEHLQDGEEVHHNEKQESPHSAPGRTTQSLSVLETKPFSFDNFNFF